MKISHKLTLVFLVTALLITAAGFLFVKKSEGIMSKAIQKNMQILTAETLNKIDRGIYMKIEAMQSFSEDMNFQNFLKKSNEEFEKIPDREKIIDEYDAEWRALPKEKTDSFIESILQNAASHLLNDKVNFYNALYGYPIYPEMHLTNRYSAIIAANKKTSDYRQNDESWYQEALKEEGRLWENVARHP